ncbi:uncharacterized protein LOC135161338 [Diachasmimorpha longicaudata]|uniref:uncharacterized protein LOC135161338 n=1 Tax=Diachasmimorpha longicaudata TaxID=58733 RepID=UPI0030B8B50E
MTSSQMNSSPKSSYQSGYQPGTFKPKKSKYGGNKANQNGIKIISDRVVQYNSDEKRSIEKIVKKVKLQRREISKTAPVINIDFDLQTVEKMKKKNSTRRLGHKSAGSTQSGSKILKVNNKKTSEIMQVSTEEKKLWINMLEKDLDLFNQVNYIDKKKDLNKIQAREKRLKLAEKKKADFIAREKRRELAKEKQRQFRARESEKNRSKDNTSKDIIPEPMMELDSSIEIIPSTPSVINLILEREGEDAQLGPLNFATSTPKKPRKTIEEIEAVLVALGANLEQRNREDDYEGRWAPTQRQKELDQIAMQLDQSGDDDDEGLVIQSLDFTPLSPSNRSG